MTVELNSLREPSNDNISCTHLPDLLNGRGEYVEDDHPLLKRRLIRHFHQDHIGVNHQEAQVEELVEEAKRGQSSLNVLHTRDSCLYVLHYDEERSSHTDKPREEIAAPSPPYQLGAQLAVLADCSLQYAAFYHPNS